MQADIGVDMAGAACSGCRVHKGLWKTASVFLGMPANEEGTGSVVLLLIGREACTSVSVWQKRASKMWPWV
jgi:hypothetical protein